jgi:hypothetical protein
MYSFAEELIKVDGARESFFKLRINGKCLIDEFWNRTLKEGNYEDDFDKVSGGLKDTKGQQTDIEYMRRIKVAFIQSKRK